MSLASQDSDAHYSGDTDPHSVPVESSSLGRHAKEGSGLRVPTASDGLASPGSLSDLRMSADNVSTSASTARQGKMPSSLSLQTELPLHAAANGHKSSNGVAESSSRQSLSTPPDMRGIVHRTVSVGSEALSEAFFSADEDQVCTCYVYGFLSISL